MTAILRPPRRSSRQCWAGSCRPRSNTSAATTRKARGAIPSINDATPKPPDLDWNAWLGDAPKIAWNPHHYFEWRNYAAYSGGISTDLFIHRITRIMKACDLLYPRRVVGMGGIWQWPDGRDLPDNFEMICEYPRGMTVYVLGTMSNRVGIDHLIRGYRATLYFTNTGWEIRDKDGKLLESHQKTGGEDIIPAPHEPAQPLAARRAAELSGRAGHGRRGGRLHGLRVVADRPDDGLGRRRRAHGPGQHVEVQPVSGNRAEILDGAAAEYVLRWGGYSTAASEASSARRATLL